MIRGNKKFILIFAVLASLGIVFADDCSATWYDSSWAYRIKVTVNGDLIGGTLTNFPVYVNLNQLGGNFFDHVRSDGGDIRVTRSNGSTLVAHELVNINTTSNLGELHFRSNSLSAGADKDFYIYYGNSKAKEPAVNAQYGKYNVWNGTYSYVYHLSSKPFGLVRDSSKTQLKGSSTGYMNGNNFVAGMTRNGFSFDGSNDYIATSGISTFSGASTATISGWVKRSATNQNVRLGGQYDPMMFGQFGVTSSGGSIYGYVDSATYVSAASNDTNWHHVALVFDAMGFTDSDKLKLYLDNSTAANSIMGMIPMGLSNNLLSQPLRIGSVDGSTFHKGSLDEVRFSTTALSSSWISAEYYNYYSPSAFTLIAAEEENTALGAVFFSPADNGYGMSSDNLVITFNKIADIQTGNVTIKKTSDNSTVETISVASGQVTGNGTTQITINPSVTLSNGTAYYVQIDNAAFKDNSGNAYAGISNTTSWSFTAASWYSNSWPYRIKLTVDKDKVPSNLTDFPVYVNLNNMPGHFFDNIKSDGSDIRVTLANGVGLVPREIVGINTTTNAGEMHFKASGTLSSTADTVFYVYYGNTETTEPTASSQFGKYNTWNGTYLHVYHLAEKPFGIVADSAKLQRKGFSEGYMNGTHSIAGILDNGTNFDGTNDRIGISSITGLASVSKFTLSSWVKRNASGYNIRIGQTSDGGSDYVQISSTSTKITADINSMMSGAIGSVNVLSNDTSWHQVIMAFNGSASANGDKLRLYYDGSLDLSTVSTDALNLSSTPSVLTPFYLGHTSSAYHRGGIDEVKLSSKALTPDWISAEYSNQYSPSTFYSVSSFYDTSSALNVLVFDPADNGYGARNQNFVITFNKPVDIQTGNLVIKKAADDSTVETIDVTSGQVTGNGTTQITINPSTSLSNGTAYYVQIDASAFDDTFGKSYAGIADTSTWNFSVAGWYSSSWPYRIKLTVDKDKVPGDLTDFPVYVNLNNLPGHFFDNIKSDGSDIRVTLANGVGLVPREIAMLNTTTNAGEMHFKATGTLSSSTDTSFYIYYGNSSTTEPTASSQFGKYNVWNGTYLHVYHLDEKPFGAVSDSAKLQRKGYSEGNMNGTHSIAGILDNGTNFDGSNDRISISNMSGLSSASKLTISTWAKRNGSGYNIRLGQTSDSFTDYIQISSTATKITGEIYGSSNWATANVLSNDTSWHHLMMVYNGSASANGDRLKMYFDGSGEYSSAPTDASLTSTPSLVTPFYLGYSSSAYDRGGLDETRVTNKAVTANWAKAEYNNQNSPSTFYTVDSNYDYSTAPVAIAFNPADNGYADKSQDLTITFNRAIDIQTGNITIKKSSNNSTVETIDVTSGKVTGNGTSIITINPSSNLVNGTAYYVQIDASAFDDTLGNSYPGIADTSTWNFTTANWYNGSWLYRVKLTINHDKVAANLTSFPVYVNLNHLPGHFFDNVKADGGDIRVTLANGTGLVPREIVRIDTTTNAGEMHFKAGSLSSTADTDYFIYYGNSGTSEPASNSTYGEQKVWNGNFAYVYHMGDTPTGSSDIDDSTASNNDATSYGTMAAASTGKVDKGLTFDGSDDKIDLGMISTVSSASKFTLSTWAKRTSSGYNIRLGQSNMGGDYVQLSSTSTKITADINEVMSATNATTNVMSNDTSWHHLMMVFNGSASTNGDRLKFYFDGTNENSTVPTMAPSMTPMMMTSFYIGYSESSWTYDRGMLDEVRLSTKALNQYWASTEYNNQNSPSTFYSVTSTYSSAANIVSDTTDPTVSTLSPADGATGVAVDTNLVITFDENIDIQTGNIYIKKSSDDSTVQTIAASSTSGNGTTQITINPSDLSGSTGYYIQIAATAFDDTAGNSYAGISNTTSWNFTTAAADVTDPTISTLSPADNATGVSISSNLVITFDENIDIQTGNLYIKKTSDNSTVQTIAVTAASGNGTTQITFDPSDLASYTGYYVQIDATAFDDTAGNSFAGISNTTSWNFTTADVVAPTVSSFSPADNATSVAVNANLVINFDENIDIQTGNIYIKKSSDNSTVETIAVSSATGNGTSQITFNPSDFSGSTGYYVQIDATAFDDTSGNSYAGISNNTTWNFTTVAGADSTAWYDQAWAYRTKVTVNGDLINGSLTNFPVFVNLNQMPGDFFDHVRTDGGDIRVTLSNGTTLVPREVVNINTTSNAGELHFRASSLTLGSDKNFYVYYGNAKAKEPAANSQYGKYNVWNGNYSYVYHLSSKPFGFVKDSSKTQLKAFSNGYMNGNNLAAGLTRNGYSFDGSNDYILTNNISIFSGATKATISGWVKRSATNQNVRLAGQNEPMMFSQFGVTSSGGSIYGYVDSSSYVSVASNDTNWHHVAMVFNGSGATDSDILKMYFDTSTASNSLSGMMPTYLSYNFSTQPLRIGSIDGSSFHKGSLDEVRISTKAFTKPWITTEYNNQYTPSSFITTASEQESNGLAAIAFSPIDNGYELSDGNLVITFNKAVDVQTGNVTIKKTSGGTTVETIDVTSGQVTGNGTSQITINPSSTLVNGTSYYVQIDSTAFDDSSGNSYPGISSSTAWNFTAASWYNTSWPYRVKLTVDPNKVPANLTDFPVFVNLNSMPGHFFDNVKSDGSDIRVTLANGVGLVPREIVYLNTTSNAGEMHFKATGTLSTTSDSSYFIYYGNTETTEPAANSQYGKYNVWNGTYLHTYHLEEKPFGTVADSAKLQRKGFSEGYMNGANSIAAILDNGDSFDGTNDRIGINSITGLSSVSKFSMSSWVKRNASGYNIRLGQSNTGGDYIQFSSSASKITGDVYSMMGGGSTTSVNVLSNDTSWHHLIMVFNGSASTNGDRLRMYFDGSQDSTSVAPDLPFTSSPAITDPFYIGYTSSAYHRGGIDETRITNKAISPEWAQAEYYNQYSPSTFYSVSSNHDTSSVLSAIAFDPPDNGYGTQSQNLIITFNRAVDIQTGNVTIKKTSDNSTIEAISVSSGQVTGNGTAQITINPSVTLTNGTAYYVQIDSSAFDDTAGNSYPGIADTSTWNFSVAGWYNSSWPYRVELTVDKDKVGGSLTDFPVYVNLHDMPDHFFNNVKTDGGDIRVTLTNGVGLVPREIVTINTTSNAGEMHFKATGTLANTSDTTYYVYYGNAAATEPTANSQFGKYNVWNGTYLHVYHLDEKPFGAVADSAKLQRTGYSEGYMNGTHSIAGILDNGDNFDGTNDRIGINSVTGLSSVSKFSMSSWVKRNASGYNVRIGQSNTGGDYVQFSSSGTKITGDVYSMMGGGTNTSVNVLSNDTNWHHVIMVFNGSASTNGDRLKMYFDGSGEYGSAALDIPFTSTPSITDPFYIGYTSSAYHKGAIDESRITSKAINQAWATTEYNNQYSPSTFYTINSTYDTSSSLNAIAFNPPDNGYAGKGQDLVITFNRAVDIQTGNVTIKKTSGDTTIETIDVTSGQVTGNGTAQITINPSVYLTNGTAYYVQVDSSAFDDTSGNSYAGIADTSTWNFTVAGWYNGSWLYRTKLTVDHNKVASNLTSFPVYVNLADLPTHFFNNVRSDGGDIRVTLTNGVGLVPREVNRIDTSGKTGELHFKAAGTLSSTTDTDYYIYYGNSSATEPTASSTYGEQKVWNGTHAYVYHLGDTPTGSGADIDDTTASNNEGYSYGTMSAASTGKVDKALTFDGSDDKIDIGMISTLSSASKFTLSTWVKRNSSGYNIRLGQTTMGGDYVQISSTSTKITNDLYDMMSGSSASINTPSNDTNWHYIAMVFNGSASSNGDRLKMYIDGSTDNTTSSLQSPSTSPNVSSNSFYIGYLDNSWTYHRGMIDELRISSKALSPYWIQTTYNNQNSPSTFYSIATQDSLANPDTTAPTVSSFSPADNATGVSISANLVINFDENIDIQTGNLYIKKSADNSTVQTIAVTSATGNGTNQITFNPSDLAYSNGYYVQIDATAFDDTSGNSYAGISNTTTWNFTTTNDPTPTDWLGAAWTKRIKVEVNKSQINGSVANFPVYVNLNGLSATFFDDVLTNGADLRVTKSDGTTQVAREVVWLSKTSNAGELHFVMNGTYTNSSNGVFYLYYGNGSATEPSASSTYGRNKVWVNSYVAVWHMNENPGASSITDSTGNSNTATPQGSMDVNDKVAGKLGYALDFDGVDDYLTTSNTTKYQPFTLSAWVYNTTTSGQVILAKRSYCATATDDFPIWFYSTGTGTVVEIDEGSDYSGGAAASKSGLSTSTWNHMVTTYDSSTLKIYGNTSVSSSSTSLTMPTGSRAWTIGRVSYNSGCGALIYKDKMDEVRIASVARNGSWVKTEYNNQSSPATFYSIQSPPSSTLTPIVLGFSPADNTSGVAIDANLVINFDRKIDIQSGNITIKKASDNSTVETIAAASLTGNGTSQITINPSDFIAGTGYYVQIDASLFDDTAGNSYAGIADTTTWNFTTAGGGWFLNGWTKRTKLTVNASYVNGSVTDFPVYVKLGDMPSTFFTSVKSDGGDIRVTDTNGNPCAVEVVALDLVNGAGEMHFKAPGLSSSANKDFYIYYGNTNGRMLNGADTYGSQNVWSNGYVAVYHMQENPGTSGEVLRDSTRYCNQGTFNGSMNGSDKVKGQVANGTALDFDGSDDYISFGSTTFASNGSAFAVSVWAKLTNYSANSYPVLLTLKSSGATTPWELHFSQTASYDGILIGSNSTWAKIYTGSGSSLPGSWYHVAVSYNGSAPGTSSNFSIYKNSTLQSNSAAGAFASASNVTQIADAAGGSSNNFVGILDEIRISSKTRNGNWIKTEYNNQNAPGTFYTIAAQETNADDSNPKVVSFNPPTAAVRVPKSSKLYITFSESVSAGAGNILIKDSSNDSTFQTIACSAVAGGGSANITISPNAFTSSKTYYVNIDTNCFYDGSANYYSGISNKYAWRFSTVDGQATPYNMFSVPPGI